MQSSNNLRVTNEKYKNIYLKIIYISDTLSNINSFCTSMFLTIVNENKKFTNKNTKNLRIKLIIF